MISVAQAQALILERSISLEAEAVPLAQAHGRILRKPVASMEDQPPFDRSAMDGYVFRADDLSNEFEIVGEIRAGEMVDVQLQYGQAMRIFTGARLPGPGLKVAMQEDVEAFPPRMRIVRHSGAAYVRHRGEDARAGEELLAPGIRLDAAAVALMASVGKTSPLVSRQPRILHLTTGDEVVSPEQPLEPGQIRNSNAFLISTLCHEWGAGTVTHLHAPDRLDAMIELVAQAKPKAHDLILISGGSGPGKYDFTSELFRHLEAEILFRQVDVRPGKPLIFGTSTGHVIFGLPGNALSHFVCFHLFVRTALAGLLARPPAATASASLAEPLADALNSRETWWPAQTEVAAGRVEIRALPWKSSGDITRLPGADALIRVPGGTADFPAETMVEYLSTRDTF